jgi:hypothetical protein
MTLARRRSSPHDRTRRLGRTTADFSPDAAAHAARFVPGGLLNRRAGEVGRE